mgnify:CR=1 FL=1
MDNRSLLYEKFALPKVWGQKLKLDDASRWSVLRIVSCGRDLLLADAESLERRASGRDVLPDNAERMRSAAQIARRMANIREPNTSLVNLANANAAQMLHQLESAYPGHIVIFEATLGGRLMVNIAGGVIENAGICLDRCFGLPFIPGSAVKGIARLQALWEIKEAAPAERGKLLNLAMAIFGYGKVNIRDNGDWTWAAGREMVDEGTAALEAAEFKGCACFLPAYPTTPPTIVADMVNPHYPKYYRGKRTRATDDESPIPNYFPAVEAGCSFGFAVLLNRVPAGFTASQLLDAVRGWIERAITQKGLGAKIAAGYGWFELGGKQEISYAAGAIETSTAHLKEEVPLTPADKLIAKWSGKLRQSGNFAVALPELAALEDDATLKQVFEAVIPQEERARNRKNNPYWQSFTSGRHGEFGKTILARVGFTLR